MNILPWTYTHIVATYHLSRMRSRCLYLYPLLLFSNNAINHPVEYLQRMARWKTRTIDNSDNIVVVVVIVVTDNTVIQTHACPAKLDFCWLAWTSGLMFAPKYSYKKHRFPFKVGYIYIFLEPFVFWPNCKNVLEYLRHVPKRAWTGRQRHFECKATHKHTTTFSHSIINKKCQAWICNCHWRLLKEETHTDEGSAATAKHRNALNKITPNQSTRQMHTHILRKLDNTKINRTKSKVNAIY